MWEGVWLEAWTNQYQLPSCNNVTHSPPVSLNIVMYTSTLIVITPDCYGSENTDLVEQAPAPSKLLWVSQLGQCLNPQRSQPEPEPPEGAHPETITHDSLHPGSGEPRDLSPQGHPDCVYILEPEMGRWGLETLNKSSIWNVPLSEQDNQLPDTVQGSEVRSAWPCLVFQCLASRPVTQVVPDTT